LGFADVCGEELFAVSIYPERSAIIPSDRLSPEVLEVFLKANRDLLEDPRCCVGTWYNAESDVTFIDVIAAVPDRDHALRLAMRYNQVAIFDLAAMSEIETGGTASVPPDLPPIGRRLDDEFDVG